MSRTEDAAARRWRPHQPAHGWNRRRKPKTNTGLDGDHRAERDRQMRHLRTLGQAPCRRCDQPMVHPELCPAGRCRACTLHLGHLIPRALGGGREGRALEHAHCNIADGARLGQRLAWAPRTSRQW